MSPHSVLPVCALLAAMALPTSLTASPLPVLPSYGATGSSNTYPGAAFDWPAPVDAYLWFVDISGVTTAPTLIADFTVTNTATTPLTVATLQAFGNCDGISDPWKPGFTLFINETETPWTRVETAPCGYHDYLDFSLPVGATRFSVRLDDPPDATAIHVDMRFGNVIPAIPLPPAGLLMLGGMGALALVRRLSPV